MIIDPFNCPVFHPEKKYLDYLASDQYSYNECQYKVLQNFVYQRPGSISLCQGPPGTGKSHTILELVKMLVKTGARRILVCTSSNKIIDDMTHRLLEHDLGLKYGEIMRICSQNHEPGEKIKKHSLDQIVNRYLNPKLF